MPLVWQEWKRVLETEVGLLRIFKGGISVTHNDEHLAGPHILLAIYCSEVNPILQLLHYTFLYFVTLAYILNKMRRYVGLNETLDRKWQCNGRVQQLLRDFNSVREFRKTLRTNPDRSFVRRNSALLARWLCLHFCS